MDEKQFTPSSGNVFADIGLPDTGEPPLKAKLAGNLQRLMKLHKLTQEDVAKRVGSDQPTISDVLRGHLNLVTVDRLLQWHSRLGQDVFITIQDQFHKGSVEDKKPGVMSVLADSRPL